MKTFSILIVFLLFAMVFQANADKYRIFSDATKEYVLHDATVTVLDANGNRVATGRTDSQGEVTFNLNPGVYTGIITFQGSEYNFEMEMLNEPDAVHDIYLVK